MVWLKKELKTKKKEDEIRLNADAVHFLRVVFIKLNGSVFGYGNIVVM